MSGKKIAIVTGASSGMGREMVYLLADHFAALEEIWVIARRKDRLEELVGKVPCGSCRSIFQTRKTFACFPDF